MQLQLSNLVYSYNPNNTLKFPDVQLATQENLLVIGASGCGKTTLLHLIAGFLKPTRGQVLIKATNISALSNKQLDKFRATEIGIVWQKSVFVQALSMLENLKLMQKLGKYSTSNQELTALCTSLNLTSLLHKKPLELSVGEQQRFSIIRAVLNKPKVLLADEPTSALDDENALKVANLLLNTATQNKASLILVTHDNRIKHLFNKHLQM